MNQNQSAPAALLEVIALGEASPEAASSAISELLVQSNDQAVATSIYDALRGWTWKALESRRRDPELVRWVELIGAVVAIFEKRGNALAAKVETLVELLQPSIELGALHDADDPLRRKHVCNILAFVFGQERAVGKRELMQNGDLAEANMTRVMGPLLDRGWLQREVRGREVFYRLTERGKQVAAPVHAEQSRARTKYPPMLMPHRIESYVAAYAKGTFTRYGRLSSEFRSTGPSNYQVGLEESAMVPVVASSKARSEPIGEPEIYPVAA